MSETASAAHEVLGAVKIGRVDRVPWWVRTLQTWLVYSGDVALTIEVVADAGHMLCGALRDAARSWRGRYGDSTTRETEE